MPSRKHSKSRKRSKSTKSTKSKKCRAGRVRNPLTGRCIKIKTLQAYLNKSKSKSRRKYSRHRSRRFKSFKTTMDGKLGNMTIIKGFVPPGF